MSSSKLWHSALAGPSRSTEFQKNFGILRFGLSTIVKSQRVRRGTDSTKRPSSEPHGVPVYADRRPATGPPLRLGSIPLIHSCSTSVELARSTSDIG